MTHLVAIIEPLRNRKCGLALPFEAYAHGPQPPKSQRSIIGGYDMAQLLRTEAEALIPSLPRRRGAHHKVGMSAHMLGQRGDGDIATMAESFKAERRGPRVVDETDRALVSRYSRKCGDVADFHGQTPGHFEHNGPCAIAKRRFERLEIERVEETMLHTEGLEQSHRRIACRFVGVVGDEQDVAAAQNGQ